VTRHGGDAQTRRRADAAARRHCDAQTSLRGIAAALTTRPTQQRGDAAMRTLVIAATQQCVHLSTRRRGDAATLRRGDAATRQRIAAAMQLLVARRRSVMTCSTAIQQALQRTLAVPSLGSAAFPFLRRRAAPNRALPPLLALLAGAFAVPVGILVAHVAVPLLDAEWAHKTSERARSAARQASAFLSSLSLFLSRPLAVPIFFGKPKA